MYESLGGTEDVFAIHVAFAATEYGEKLAANVRYERYNLAHVANETWVALLGADVNNLLHMPLTYGLTKSFIRATDVAQPGYFDADEKILLQVAAIIHDQGEAIVGDISFGDKTDADEASEKLAFENNLEAFCPGVSVAMKQCIVAARDTVVFDATTKLGRMFNAIERSGYVRTALRAAMRLQTNSAGQSDAGLRWILADVLGVQPAKLIEYAADYPAVDGYLHAQQDKISTAYTLVHPEDFRHYGDQEIAKQEQFIATQALWQRYRRNHLMS
ncbi:MAG: hypothetical protein JWN38_597 [Candidatus Saccharibacteria bacterium]|nr:hypothetical protein [Candidatus Saccharibacteria bacterium]